MTAKKTITKLNGKPLEGELVPDYTDVSTTTGINLTTIGRLIEAFHNSYNIREACQWAGISHDTYYRWRDKYPIFAQKMQEAQDTPNRVAKEKITKAIADGDISTARWYVERRDPDFASKGELRMNPDTIKTKEKIKGFLDDTDDLESKATDAPSAEPSDTATGEAGSEVAQSTPPVS